MESKHSPYLTALLCALLVVGNYAIGAYPKYSYFSYLDYWPVAFILCVWIAARFFHGHESP